MAKGTGVPLLGEGTGGCDTGTGVGTGVTAAAGLGTERVMPVGPGTGPLVGIEATGTGRVVGLGPRVCAGDGSGTRVWPEPDEEEHAVKITRM